MTIKVGDVLSRQGDIFVVKEIYSETSDYPYNLIRIKDNYSDTYSKNFILAATKLKKADINAYINTFKKDVKEFVKAVSIYKPEYTKELVLSKVL